MPANSSGASVYAKHPTIPFLYLGLTDSTSKSGTDPITFCLFRGNNGNPPSTDTNTYHSGCIAQVVDASDGGDVYINTGTYAVPVWSEVNGGATTFYESVSAATNGTSLVPLFGTSNPFSGSITSIQVISGSSSSVNVTISNNGTNVGTVATSATSGVVTGSGNFTVIPFTLGGSVNIVNSVAGVNSTATLIATFITL